MTIITDYHRNMLVEELVTPTPLEKAREEVDSLLFNIRSAWPTTIPIPDDLGLVLADATKLSVAELDTTVKRLGCFARDIPAIGLRLPLLILMMARLGGSHSLELAGAYYKAALFPPASDALVPRHVLTPRGDSCASKEQYVVAVSPTDQQIDGRLFETCDLVEGTYDAYRTIEDDVATMSQADTQFPFACAQEDALRRDYFNLLDTVCEMWARTPAGRLAKTTLAQYLGQREEVGPESNDVRARLTQSIDRDHDRAIAQGWTVPRSR